jgi:hypothetical protein
MNERNSNQNAFKQRKREQWKNETNNNQNEEKKEQGALLSRKHVRNLTTYKEFKS